MHEEFSKKVVEIEFDQEQKEPAIFSSGSEMKQDKFNQGLNEILEENEPFENEDPLETKYAKTQKSETPNKTSRMLETIGNLSLNQ